MSNPVIPVVIGTIILLVCLPLLVWHFFIFPNLYGFMLDLSFYNNDIDSEHFLYWSGFWLIFMGGGISLIKVHR